MKSKPEILASLMEGIKAGNVPDTALIQFDVTGRLNDKGALSYLVQRGIVTLDETNLLKQGDIR